MLIIIPTLFAFFLIIDLVFYYSTPISECTKRWYYLFPGGGIVVYTNWKKIKFLNKREKYRRFKMGITHEDIMKCIRGGQPSRKFNGDVIVYSEDEVKANVYNAMIYIKKRFRQDIINLLEDR